MLSPLFPGYLFTRIELQWRGVRLRPGLIKLVMNGEEPSHVPDEIIEEIRARERNGAIELLKHKLKTGNRVQSSPACPRAGAGAMPARRRVSKSRCCCSCSALSARCGRAPMRSSESDSD